MTEFTSKQKSELRAPLLRDNVKQRKNYGGGGSLSYLESWFAIQEANRIFGHDGWSSETVQIERIATTPYKKGSDEMVAVSYMARVRVTAGGVSREGCGYGDGQGRMDKAGAAHELALKEAESDARKRALMTFGNPFGLALYDKTQANVVDIKPEPKGKSRELYAELSGAVANTESLDELKKVWESRQSEIKSLPMDWQGQLEGEKDTRKNQLLDKQAAA